MDRSRPNVFHRGAAAFLACFQTLTLLGRNRDSGAKLSVGIHTVSVAEKAKYRLVICYNKKKRRTAWKKVATQDWDFTAEFADSVPEEKKKVRVELQRKKKCKVKTIGVTTLDPTRALQEDGPVLVKDWYVFDPPKKGRQDKNVSLLEATVAVKGLKVERKTTQETGSTPPSKENAKPEVRPESSAELKDRDVTAETTCQADGAEKLDTSVQDKLPAPSSGDNEECRPASTGATSGSQSSTTTNGAGDVQPSRIRTLFGFVAKKKSETILKSTDEGGSTKPPDKTKEEKGVTEDGPKNSLEQKESKTTSQTTEGETELDKSRRDEPTSPSSGDSAHCKPTASAPNGSTTASPSSTSTTTQTLANGEGDVRPGRIYKLFGFIARKEGGTTKSAQGEGPTKSPDKTNEEKGVTEDGPKNSLEQNTPSQTTEGETEVDRSGHDEPTSPSSGDSAHCKPTASAPNGSTTTVSPSSTSTTTQTPANGEGDVSLSRVRQLFGFIAKKGGGTTKSAEGEADASNATNEETVAIEGQLKSSSDKKESQLAPKSASQKTEGETELDKSGRDEPTSPSGGDSAHCKPTAPNGSTTASPSSTLTTKTPANGEEDVRPSRIYKLFGFITKKEGGMTKSAQGEEASDATNEETVPIEGQLKSSSDKKESQLAPKTTVQTAEEEKPGETGQDKPAVPPCGCVECTKVKPESSSTNSSTSLSPTSSATDKSLTNGEGDAGHAKPKSERPSRFRQLVSFMKKKDNSKTTADQLSPQLTDPLCLDMMSCIRELWEDLIPKRAYSKELFDYANTLMAKLEAAAPHTKENTILKNLFAKVPDYTHYELPEMEGLSLQELNQIHKTTECLLDEEERRATFIRRWLIDDICRVALEEAPKVLESTGPP
ncbi:uncharacterized protein LOC144927348 [Branchiostoma floridae x Branchiostoma belcheri]